MVPVTGTRLALSHLNLTINNRWYAWYADEEVIKHNFLPKISENLQHTNKNI